MVALSFRRNMFTYIGWRVWTIIDEIMEQRRIANEIRMSEAVKRKTKPKKHMPVLLTKPYQQVFTGLRFPIGGHKK